MAINYSLGLRKTNPSDKNSEIKVFAYTQFHEVLDIDQQADHIKTVRVQWEPGNDFLTLIQESKFRYIATRRQQA